MTISSGKPAGPGRLVTSGNRRTYWPNATSSTGVALASSARKQQQVRAKRQEASEQASSGLTITGAGQRRPAEWAQQVKRQSSFKPALRVQARAEHQSQAFVFASSSEASQEESREEEEEEAGAKCGRNSSALISSEQSPEHSKANRMNSLGGQSVVTGALGSQPGQRLGAAGGESAKKTSTKAAGTSARPNQALTSSSKNSASFGSLLSKVTQAGTAAATTTTATTTAPPLSASDLTRLQISDGPAGPKSSAVDCSSSRSYLMSGAGLLAVQHQQQKQSRKCTGLQACFDEGSRSNASSSSQLHASQQTSTTRLTNYVKRNNLKYVKTLIIALMLIDLLITIFVHHFAQQDTISLAFTSYKFRFSLINLLLSSIWFIILIGAILFDIYQILFVACLVQVASFFMLLTFSVIHFTYRIDYNSVNLTSLLLLLFSITILHVYLLVLAALTTYLMMAVKQRRRTIH